LLSRSDTPIEAAIRFYAHFNLTASYFVPTKTGLKKSIIDATDSFRRFLNDHHIHDFSSQGKGHRNKTFRDITVITRQGLLRTKMSLYRPETKAGDPRFWIYGDTKGRWSLSSYASPYNLLCIFVLSNEMYLLNFSDKALVENATSPESEIYSLLQSRTSALDKATSELLIKMRELGQRGFIETLRSGDTGVGFTLESLLGIRANSKKIPDYKGIEIKSGRSKKNRSTLFSKAPNWKLSPLNASQIVSRFGYLDENGRLSYYNTLKNHPNSQGLYLSIPANERFIEARALESGRDSLVALWPLDDIETAITIKHRRTFWVNVASKKSVSGREEFRYESVTYTAEPLVSNFAPLVLSGHITCDFLMHQKPEGGIRDHGYLFKMKPKNLDLLFPAGKTFSLVD